jgi:hypothetical protein
MFYLKLALVVFALALFAPQAKAQTTTKDPLSAKSCGSDRNENICLGQLLVPEKYKLTIEEAGRDAINALYSDGFAEDFALFLSRHGSDGPHAKAWNSVDQTSTISALKDKVHGQAISTYGGLRGWFVNFVYGNVAYDGGATGPIRLNRAALPRSVSSIANTIAHEVAHRAGLTHPHSDDRLEIARCEPPYVIGSLVEKHIVGPKWKASSNDCHLLSQ